MTRDEMRAKVAREMGRAIWNADHGYDGGLAQGYAALGCLLDIARVCPSEATPEMIAAADIYWQSEFPGFPTMADVKGIWRAMSAAGDLTNPPEKKYDIGGGVMMSSRDFGESPEKKP